MIDHGKPKDNKFEGNRYEFTNTTRTTRVKGGIKHSRACKTYLHQSAYPHRGKSTIVRRTQLIRHLIASCGEIQFLDRAKYPLFLVKPPVQGSQEMTENLRP